MLELAPTLSKQDVRSTHEALSDFLGIPQHDLHIVGSGYNYDNAKNINLLLDARKYSLKKVKSLLNLYKSNNKVRGPWQPDYFYFPVGGSGLDYSGSTGQAASVDVSETYNPNWSLFINRQGEGSQHKGITRYNFIKHSIPHIIQDPQFDQVVTSQGEPVAIAGRKLTQHSGMKRIFALRPRDSDGSFRTNWVEVDHDKLVSYYPEFKVSGDQCVVKHPDEFAKCYLQCSVDQLSTTEKLIDGTQFHLTTRQMNEMMRKIGTHQLNNQN